MIRRNHATMPDRRVRQLNALLMNELRKNYRNSKISGVNHFATENVICFCQIYIFVVRD